MPHMTRMKLQSINKYFFLLVMGLFLSQTGRAQKDDFKVIDKIVAQIGDEIILLSSLQEQRLQLIQSGIEGNTLSDCAFLEEFMFEKLLINQAKIDSIEVPDEMVNQEMEQRLDYIAKQIGSIEKLEEFYGKSVARIKAEFFDLIKKRMLAERMRETITENVRITPNEVKEFYKSLPKDSIPYINSKITVAQIVIYPEITTADKNLAKTRLEGYLEDILAGNKKFQNVAALYSDDPGSKLSGGDLGWQTRGTMVPEFEAALFNLKPMEISPVFETMYGYHVVQLIERKGDNYHSRHILISPKVSDMELDRAANLVDSLYKQINFGNIPFEEAARRFSQDLESKYNGGQIVNPYTNDYFWDVQNINEIDPQMYRLIQGLKIGNYSTPSLYDNYMDRKQGVRIVKLLGRTEPHIASLETDRQLIEMAAINQKKEAVIDAWIASKIGGNYVEIAPEYLKTCTFKYNWITSGL
jgi:peptidyl-prolyl cis-trans isomerase SurA